MPAPLDYASPDLRRKKTRGLPAAKGSFGFLQLFITIVLLAPWLDNATLPIREGNLASRVAFYWPGMVMVMNTISVTLLAVGARQSFQRRRKFERSSAALFLLSMVGVGLSAYLLDRFPVYIANGPATVPVNDVRFHQSDDYSWFAFFTSLTTTPLMLLFLLQSWGLFRGRSQEDS